MIKNVGGKLQGLGKFILWAGIIASVIAFVVLQMYIAEINDYYSMYDETNRMITISIIILFIGPLVSVFLGLVTNGLGTLINNTMPKPSPADPLPKPVLKTGDDII